jgi:hypothetical protein
LLTELTEHLNTVDTTGSIKFTYEEETEGRIPFLDTLLVRKENGQVKLLVYRKPTHTDHYLQFDSHHPVHHKLGVIRTLLDHSEAVVTEAEDRVKEEAHIGKALANCGYPRWAFRKVKKQRAQKAQSEQTQLGQRKEKEKNKGMVILPYVQGVTEPLSRVFNKYNISCAMRPHTTLRRLLVHPKDKVDKQKQCGVVYEVPCKNCDKSYIGETGRQLGQRVKEHREEVEKETSGVQTRTRRKESSSLLHKSAITDHAAANNHVIDWDKTEVRARVDNEFIRGVKEAIVIRKTRNIMNRDEGRYRLSHVYDNLLHPVSRGRGRGQQHQ